MDDRTKLYVEGMLKHELRKLEDDCDCMIQRMEYVKRKIAQGSVINALGEVQSMGAELDRRCSKIATLKDLLEFCQ